METARRVVAAASQLFREQGFAATTVRDIAELAGVSAGTVMAAGDKNGLLVRVFDTILADEHAGRAGDPARIGGGATGCTTRVVDLVRPFVAAFIENAPLARVYASVLVSGSHASTLFTELAPRLIDEFAEAITANGCTPAEEAPALARALYAAYVGTLLMWSAGGLDDRGLLELELETILGAICSCTERR